MTELPKIVPASGQRAADLNELATRINTEYSAILKADQDAKAANHSVVERAIALGQILHSAKERVAHGEWLNWLKTYCSEVEERTAQRYMKLADKSATLRKKMNSDTMSDLTLKQAFDLVDDKTPSANSGNVSDAYDSAQKKLIKKLEALPPDEADAAANETIKLLKSTVTTMKNAVKNAKAA
jgi:hypothetical protein